MKPNMFLYPTNIRLLPTPTYATMEIDLLSLCKFAYSRIILRGLVKSNRSKKSCGFKGLGTSLFGLK